MRRPCLHADRGLHDREVRRRSTSPPPTLLPSIPPSTRSLPPLDLRCAALEPVVKAEYLAALKAEGVSGYEAADLDRDWALATLHFPFYVAMWFGTTPDEQLVDPEFPRRFVPRCFAAIMRHQSHKLLPAAS